MSDELEHFERWAEPLLQRLAPAARRSLAANIGKALRSSQAARIKAQQNPDGSAFEPRKKQDAKKFRNKKGKIKRKMMFAKLATNRFLKMQATSEGVTVGFLGRTARLARVHQEGLPDTVQPSGRSYLYPRRRLLGFSADDLDMIREQLLKHLSGD